MSSDLTLLRMAVCLYPDCTMTDFQGPCDILTTFSGVNKKRFAAFFPNFPNVQIETEYLSHNLEPITPTSGIRVLPTMTYEEGTGFDILLIPGGMATPADSPVLVDYLKKNGPKAKYVLSVCTGSWFLAAAGLLEGQRATTNKALYKVIVEATKDLPGITWVPKARYIINDDKHIWTASGVTAGMDLAYAFTVHLTDKTFADQIKGIVEFRTVHDSEEDEFAEYYKLV